MVSSLQLFFGQISFIIYTNIIQAKGNIFLFVKFKEKESNRRIDNTFGSDKNIIWYYLKNVCTNWLFSKEDVNIYIIVLIDESIMNYKKIKHKKTSNYVIYHIMRI